MELRIWLEFDGFLRAYSALPVSVGGGPNVRAPPYILSLLPPPPSAGWPAEFCLQVAAVLQRKLAAEQEALSLFNPNSLEQAEPLYPACDAAVYPQRRRAQRLSYAIWMTISRSDDELQRALEAPSTADRLRMALQRLRQLRQELAEASDTEE